MASRTLAIKYTTEGFNEAVNSIKKVGVSFDESLKKAQQSVEEAIFTAKNAADAGDDAAYQEAEQKKVKAAKQVQQAVNNAYRELRIKSSADIEQLKDQAVSAFNALKNSGIASARDIAAAELALKKRLEELDKQLGTTEGELKGFGRVTLTVTEQIRGMNHAWSNFLSNLAANVVSNALNAITGTITNFFGSLKDQIFQAGTTTENLKSQLKTLEGSVEKAAVAYEKIALFALNTPYELEEVTQAYISLSNRGLKPTEKQLQQIGDLAASQGKPLQQYVEAILDAMTGENERLKEFGIKASKSGEQVSFTFKGITKTVQSSEQAILQALLGFSQLEGVLGGMNERAKTTEGQLSNLTDSLKAVYVAIFDSIKPALDGVIESATAIISPLGQQKDLFSDINVEAQAFRDYLKANPAIANEIANTLKQGIQVAMSAIAQSAKQILEYLQKNPTAIAQAVENLKTLLGGMAEFVKLIGTAIEGWGKIANLIKEVKGALTTGGGEVEGTRNTVAKVGKEALAEYDRRIEESKKPRPGGNFDYLIPGKREQIAYSTAQDIILEYGQKGGSGVPKPGNFTGVVATVGSTGIGTGAHLDVRGKDSKGQRLSQSELNKLLPYLYVEGVPLSEQKNKITSGYGPRKAPVKGASTFHPAYDFGFAKGTPVEFRGDAVKIEKKPNQGKGGNVLEITLKTGEVIQLLHLESFGKAVDTFNKSVIRVPSEDTGGRLVDHRELSVIGTGVTTTTTNATTNTTTSTNYREKAAAILRQEEGFRAKAYWDTNAYRIGYGTEFKGNQAKSYRVNSTITSEAAEKQLLEYDIPRFENRIIQQVGKQYWVHLNENVKAALLSVAYNKGSLTTDLITATRTGNADTIVSTIERTDAKTHGNRRRSEAALARSQDFGDKDSSGRSSAEEVRRITEDARKRVDERVGQQQRQVRDSLEQRQKRELLEFDLKVSKLTSEEAKKKASYERSILVQRQSAEKERLEIEQTLTQLRTELIRKQEDIKAGKEVTGRDISSEIKLLEDRKKNLEETVGIQQQITKNEEAQRLAAEAKARADERTKQAQELEVKNLEETQKNNLLKFDTETSALPDGPEKEARIIQRSSIEKQNEYAKQRLEIEQGINNLIKEREEKIAGRLTTGRDITAEIQFLQQRRKALEENLILEQTIVSNDISKTLSEKAKTVSEQWIEVTRVVEELNLSLADSTAETREASAIRGVNEQYEGYKKVVVEAIKTVYDLIQFKAALGLATDEEIKHLERLKQKYLEVQDAQNKDIKNALFNNQLNERQIKLDEQGTLLDFDSQIAEGKANQLDRIGDRFGANKLRSYSAIAQEDLRYQQELLDLEASYKDQPELLEKLKTKAAELNQIKLDEIRSQFKSLKDELIEIGANALTGFFEDILSGTKSVGEAFMDMAKSVIRSLTQIAAQMLAMQAIKAISGAFGFKFAGGGPVGRYADGGFVKEEAIERSSGGPIKGPGTGTSDSIRAWLSNGEYVIKADAVRHWGVGLFDRLNQKQLPDGENKPNPIRSMVEKIGEAVYAATGGLITDGSAPNWHKSGGIEAWNQNLLTDLTPRPATQLSLSGNLKGSGNAANRSTTLHQTINVTSPDANSFRKTELQLGRDSAEMARRAFLRNG